MIGPWRRRVLRALARLLPSGWIDALGRFVARPLARELAGAATDRFLEILLHGMDAAFALNRSYRRNIEGYHAVYVFRTDDGLVHATAAFEGGDMVVHGHADPSPSVEVIFRDAAALRGFLFSREQDILNSLLANEVRVRGNLNHVYRFAFLARDLAARLGKS